MQKPLVNFAFIDSQNLNLGVRRLGWALDYKRFRVYLKEKYGVRKAFLFIGYMPKNKGLYKSLQGYGYILIFKPVLFGKQGQIKGNCDAELVLHTMIEYWNYEKAVIITSDGDFYCLVDYFYKMGKLEKVLSPDGNTCSILLRKAAKNRIFFFRKLKKLLSYTKKKEDR